MQLMIHIVTAAEVEERAKKAGKSMAEVCRLAGIAQSTFTRWKAGRTEPTMGVLRRIAQVLGEVTEASP